MRLHEGKLVLVAEQVGVTTVAVAEGENRHVELLPDPADEQDYFAPVEFHATARLMVQADKRAGGFPDGLRFAKGYIAANRGIAYRMPQGEEL